MVTWGLRERGLETLDLTLLPKKIEKEEVRQVPSSKTYESILLLPLIRREK